jgi:hypothetical protein
MCWRRLRVWRPLVMLGLILGLGSLACESAPTGPDGGFLVVLTNSTGPPEIDRGGDWVLRVRELSGEIFPDTTILVQPVDTVILEVPLATYFTTLTGVPDACSVRGGPIQQGLVPEAGTTRTIRYAVDCFSYLVVRTQTVGQALDSAFVYRIAYPDGRSTFGRAEPTDTIRPDGVVEGRYRVDLAHVARNCVVTSNGGRERRLTVSPPRSTTVSFTVVCNDEVFRPRILKVGATVRDTLGAFYLEATDPGSPGAVTFPDIDRYVWDLTDCRQNSMLREGAVERSGLFSQTQRTRGQDTVRINLMMYVELADPDLPPRCVSLRVVDFDGNTTEVVEKRLSTPAGSPPVIAAFDARLVGPVDDPRLSFTLEASDPDGDLAGSYLRFILDDGSVVNRGITGHVDTTIPDFRFRGSGLPEARVVGVVVFAIDREGSFVLAEDYDLVN